MRKGLTLRQEKFIAEYVVDGNGTRAAVKAGYSPKGASVTAARNLANPNIREAVERQRKRVMERMTTAAAITKDEQVRFFKSVQDRAPFSEVTVPDALRAAREVSTLLDYYPAPRDRGRPVAILNLQVNVAEPDYAEHPTPEQIEGFKRLRGEEG